MNGVNVGKACRFGTGGRRGDGIGWNCHEQNPFSNSPADRDGQRGG